MNLSTEIISSLISVVVASLVSILLFYLRSKKDAPKKDAEVNGIRASIQKTMQETIDGLSERVEKQAERIDELKQILDDNKMLLVTEIEKRKALEKANLKLIQGLNLLINQLRELNIEPVWMPTMSQKD